MKMSENVLRITSLVKSNKVKLYRKQTTQVKTTMFGRVRERDYLSIHLVEETLQRLTTLPDIGGLVDKLLIVAETFHLSLNVQISIEQ